MFGRGKQSAEIRTPLSNLQTCGDFSCSELRTENSARKTRFSYLFSSRPLITSICNSSGSWVWQYPYGACNHQCHLSTCRDCGSWPRILCRLYSPRVEVTWLPLSLASLMFTINSLYGCCQHLRDQSRPAFCGWHPSRRTGPFSHFRSMVVYRPLVSNVGLIFQ